MSLNPCETYLLEQKKHEIWHLLYVQLRPVDKAYEILVHHGRGWIKEKRFREAINRWEREDPVAWPERPTYRPPNLCTAQHLDCVGRPCEEYLRLHEDVGTARVLTGVKAARTLKWVTQDAREINAGIVDPNDIEAPSVLNLSSTIPPPPRHSLLILPPPPSPGYSPLPLLSQCSYSTSLPPAPYSPHSPDVASGGSPVFGYIVEEDVEDEEHDEEEWTGDEIEIDGDEIDGQEKEESDNEKDGA